MNMAQFLYVIQLKILHAELLLRILVHFDEIVHQAAW